MQEMEQTARTAIDAFKPRFEIPSLASNLVFDFEYFDDNSRPRTAESILLNSMLYPGSRGNLQGASALSTHGMGGVGKPQR